MILKPWPAAGHLATAFTLSQLRRQERSSLSIMPSKEPHPPNFNLSDEYFIAAVKVAWGVLKRTRKSYAPIIGLPQDGGVGQPRGIRLRTTHVGWDFDIHNDPGVGNLTAILKSWEDLGMSDKCCAILKNTQNSFETFERVSAERKVWRSVVLFFQQKCCFYAHQCSVFKVL